jgi:hypothetical protein
VTFFVKKTLYWIVIVAQVSSNKIFKKRGATKKKGSTSAMNLFMYQLVLITDKDTVAALQ